jgi:hypothetical protein
VANRAFAIGVVPATFILRAYLGEGIGGDNATNHEPVEKTVNPLRMENAARDRSFSDGSAKPYAKHPLI